MLRYLVLAIAAAFTCPVQAIGTKTYIVTMIGDTKLADFQAVTYGLWERNLDIALPLFEAKVRSNYTNAMMGFSAELSPLAARFCTTFDFVVSVVEDITKTWYVG